MDSSVSPVHWIGEVQGGYLEIIDQKRHPDQEAWLVMSRPADVVEALAEGHVQRESEVEAAVAFAVAMTVRDRVAAGTEGVESDVEGITEKLEATEPVQAEAGKEVIAKVRGIVAEHDGDDEELVERLFEVAFDVVGDEA